MNFFKVLFNSVSNAKRISKLEAEIVKLNKKLGDQAQQLQQQQKSIKRRKDAVLGEQTRGHAYKLTIDELSKRLHLKVDQKDELLGKSWELARRKVERSGAVVLQRYSLAKNVQNKRTVQPPSN